MSLMAVGEWRVEEDIFGLEVTMDYGLRLVEGDGPQELLSEETRRQVRKTFVVPIPQAVKQRWAQQLIYDTEV